MLAPLNTPATTVVLGAPVDWNPAEDGECIGLPVQHDGNEFHSWWQPTWKDRFKVLFGHKIKLSVVGGAHPPVAINIDQAPI